MLRARSSAKDIRRAASQTNPIVARSPVNEDSAPHRQASLPHCAWRDATYRLAGQGRMNLSQRVIWRSRNDVTA